MFDARLLKSEGKKESIDDTVNNIHSPRRKKLVAGRVASKSASIGSGRVKVEEVVVSMNNLIRAKGEGKIKDKRIGEEGGKSRRVGGEIQSCSFINLRKVGPLRRNRTSDRYKGQIC